MWAELKKFNDILLEKTNDGIAKLTINRPEVRNAFRPQTVNEMLEALDIVHNDSEIGILILTGAGDKAFCSGGDQKVRGDAGYVGDDGVPRLNILEVQKRIRSLPIPVIAMVAGYAIGGGHVLHVVCDITIAADNAIFGQTGLRWVLLTEGLVQVIWRELWVKKKHVKFGFCAVSTMPTKRLKWA